MPSAYVSGKLVIMTTRDVLNEQVARQVLGALRRHGVAPDLVSETVPLLSRFYENQFADHWVGRWQPGGFSGSYWQAAFAGGQVSNSTRLAWQALLAEHLKSALSFCMWTGSNEKGTLADFERLIALGLDLCKIMDATYGYVMPIEAQAAPLKHERETTRLDSSLPAIHWVTFIGHPWVDHVRCIARSVDSLSQYESDGIMVLRMDSDPWSDDVLSGRLSDDVRSLYYDKLFAPGALPPVSYADLWRKVRLHAESPPQATSTFGPWARIVAGLETTSISDQISEILKREDEFRRESPVIHFELDFSLESLLRLSDWVEFEFTGYQDIIPEWGPDDDIWIGFLGAYFGESMRRALGGSWAINPQFPDFPAIRIGGKWLYPFGEVEQRLRRLAGHGFTLADYFVAHAEIENRLSCDGDTVHAPEAEAARLESLANAFASRAYRDCGTSLDFSLESLRTLDYLVSVYRMKESEFDFEQGRLAYIGEVLKRAYGGEWIPNKHLGPSVRVPISRSGHAEISLSSWSQSEEGINLLRSASLKASAYLPDFELRVPMKPPFRDSFWERLRHLFGSRQLRLLS